MPALAIDLGTYSIKMIHAKPGPKPEILRCVEGFNKLGTSVPTDDAQVEKLASALDAILNDNNLPRKDVRLSLPETVVSTKILALPSLSDAELASAIGWQAEQAIPIPPEELSLEYEVLYRPPKTDKTGQMRVLLVGTRRPVIERYLSVFTLLGIEPTLLETQILSVLRSIQMTNEDPNTMIVQIGAATMQIAMMYHGELNFVYSHLSGGQLLSRALEQGVSLDSEQAEQYKRTYGLDETQFQGKVKEALLPTTKLMLSEVQKAVRFFVSQHPTETVQRIILSGGTAHLPGLVQYVTSELGVEVLIASPFATAQGEVPQANQAIYSVCMGLVMRQL
jgi:type IV pilus assembly protein PilM